VLLVFVFILFFNFDWIIHMGFNSWCSNVFI